MHILHPEQTGFTAKHNTSQTTHHRWPDDHLDSVLKVLLLLCSVPCCSAHHHNHQDFNAAAARAIKCQQPTWLQQPVNTRPTWLQQPVNTRQAKLQP
jgi:hypothetical protein